MRQTNDTARRAFPRVFRLDVEYLRLRDQIVDTFRSLKRASGFEKLRLRLHFAGLLWSQFTQPMVPGRIDTVV
jgi:hypothetical protein